MFTRVLERYGIELGNAGAHTGDGIGSTGGAELVSINPSTGAPIGAVRQTQLDDYQRVVQGAEAAFARWRLVPAPRRGEFVRALGNKLREHKRDLGLLVTLETGKIRAEGEGEVQEMIDMCDFAVGLSRQLGGLVLPSERPEHRLFEQWHPLGPIGVITAFNFPVAVWAWNAALAAVCGDTTVWKPAPKTPLTALAVQRIIAELIAESGAPAELSNVFNLVIGPAETVGEAMLADRRLPLISATGSCGMGRRAAEVVGRRLGKCLLELGGNNAAIVAPSADLDLALRAIVFAAVGTAGQRCTSLRRLIVHESIGKPLTERLLVAYRSIPIGDPWESGTLLGPLINEGAVERMHAALDRAVAEGGTILCGGRRLERPGFFVEPALVTAHAGMPICREETFAPILYLFPYRAVEEAIALNNSVPQGLSAAIFTQDLREGERFLSAAGCDCGIANVNIGTSGAEIGGAFGGEKDTGGGREAGSDAWKAYMRRQTCTVNFGSELPLAQGIRFELPP